MNYSKIVPEILVGLGDETVYEDQTKKKITSVHINLECWFGDDLLWEVPEAFVTENLKKGLESSLFTGYVFKNVTLTKDIYFEDNYHLDIPLPTFYWMKVLGEKGKDDLYIDNFELYASTRIIKFLKDNYKVDNMDIDPERDKFDDFIDKLISDGKNKKE